MATLRLSTPLLATIIVVSGCGSSTTYVETGRGAALEPGEPSYFKSSTADAELQHRPGGREWVRLCRAPCRPPLKPGETYRVVSSRGTPAYFSAPDGPVEIGFDGQGGVMTRLVGLAAGTAGGLVALGGIVHYSDDGHALEAGGLVAGGLLGVAGGIILWRLGYPVVEIRSGAQGTEQRTALGGGLEISPRGLHF